MLSSLPVHVVTDVGNRRVTAITPYSIVSTRRPAAAVFVGDDGPADIQGAANVGMRTIHLRRGQRRVESPLSGEGCDAAVTTLLKVPEIADRLVPQGGAHVV